MVEAESKERDGLETHNSAIVLCYCSRTYSGPGARTCNNKQNGGYFGRLGVGLLIFV